MSLGGGRKEVHTALIVEDDACLAEVLRAFVAERAAHVQVARSRREALRCVEAARVDVALLDIGLPDGNGFEVLDDLWRQPAIPQVIVITGSATPDSAFRLAEAGVRSFLAKPVALERLALVWDDVLTRAPNLRPLIRNSVGRVHMKDLEYFVRYSMIEEALAIGEESRRRAARLLGISRQLLQHILRGQKGTPQPGLCPRPAETGASGREGRRLVRTRNPV